MYSLSAGWKSRQMSCRWRDSIVDAKCVRSDGVGDGRVRLEEDLSSIGCMMVLKSPPTICGRCGERRIQEDISLRNFLPGLFGAYMLEITRVLLPSFMCVERKRPWLSVSTDSISQGRFLWINMITPALRLSALEPRTVPTQSFFIRWRSEEVRWVSWSRAISVFSLLRWRRILSLLTGDLSPFTFQEVTFM